MSRKLDLTGKRFDRIVIQRKIGVKNSLTYWEYKCDCGKLKQATTGAINAGRIKSCGCLKAERIGSLKRIEFGQSAKNRLISIYKNRAIKKKLEWNLTDDLFFEITNQPCHYCGQAPTNNTKKISPHSFGHIVFNGIDRIDSNQGYTTNNCLPCCHHCNLAKCDFSYDDFMKWLHRIIRFRGPNDQNSSHI